MDLPESISKKDIEKLIVYLKSLNYLTSENSIISFRNRVNNMSEEDFTRFINRLVHINK